MGFAFIKNLVRRFKKSPDPNPPSASQSEAGATPGSGKRPAGFSMPTWTKKDYFAKKDLGSMEAPEEWVEEAAMRRPGDWLRKKIAGTDRRQDFEDMIQSEKQGVRKVGISDGEIDDFLGGFIGDEDGGQNISPPKKKGEGP